MKYLFIHFTLLSMLSFLPTAFGQSFLPNNPTSLPYTAADNIFSVDLPGGWYASVANKTQRSVDFRPENPAVTAWLNIEYQQVVQGASAKQMLARGIEIRLQKFPHFREIMRKNIQFSGGGQSASITGAYWYQGNAQYPRTVEETYLVIGSDAFIFHFECFEPLTNALSSDLHYMYQTFTAKPTSFNLNEVPGGNTGNWLFKEFSF